MKNIVKTRREEFGGILFSEKPGFVSYVNKPFADAMRMSAPEGAVMDPDVFTAPLDVHMALTSRCNMWCKGCYATSAQDKLLDMPLALAKAIIENFAGLGVLSISFGGGEPTLHSDLFEIAGYCREKNILPNMTTNGISLTEENAAEYSVFGNVHFSLHYPKDLDNVLRAAKLYRKATHKKPGLNLLMNTETLPHLEHYVKEAKKAGFGKILFLRYKYTDKNIGIGGLDIDERADEIPKLLIHLSKKYRIFCMFDCSFFQTVAPSKLIKKRGMYKSDVNGCMGGNAYIAVDIYGKYKPCSFWNDSFGDAVTLDCREWHDNPKLKEFRSFKQAAACNSCEWSDLCRGGCRISALRNKCGMIK